MRAHRGNPGRVPTGKRAQEDGNLVDAEQKPIRLTPEVAKEIAALWLKVRDDGKSEKFATLTVKEESGMSERAIREVIAIAKREWRSILQTMLDRGISEKVAMFTLAEQFKVSVRTIRSIIATR